MMAKATNPRDELFSVIDREAADEVEKNESKMIYDALAERRERVGASAEIPAEDEKLSATLHREAQRRSQEISAHQAMARDFKYRQEGKPLGTLLIAMWVIAIVGAAVAIKFFW